MLPNSNKRLNDTSRQSVLHETEGIDLTKEEIQEGYDISLLSLKPRQSSSSTCTTDTTSPSLAPPFSERVRAKHASSSSSSPVYTALPTVDCTNRRSAAAKTYEERAREVERNKRNWIISGRENKGVIDGAQRGAGRGVLWALFSKVGLHDRDVGNAASFNQEKGGMIPESRWRRKWVWIGVAGFAIALALALGLGLSLKPSSSPTHEAQQSSHGELGQTTPESSATSPAEVEKDSWSQTSIVSATTLPTYSSITTDGWIESSWNPSTDIGSSYPAISLEPNPEATVTSTWLDVTQEAVPSSFETASEPMVTTSFEGGFALGAPSEAGLQADFSTSSY